MYGPIGWYSISRGFHRDAKALAKARMTMHKIVPEEGADREYAFRLRRRGHNGRRLCFSKPDGDGYITVMKEAKRDAEREITMPVYSATYSGKDINHWTNARSMVQKRKDTSQYDRELHGKIDRCAEQRALELVNHRMKIERKQKAGAKRAKEAFDRLARQDTSDQVED